MSLDNYPKIKWSLYFTCIITLISPFAKLAILVGIILGLSYGRKIENIKNKSWLKWSSLTGLFAFIVSIAFNSLGTYTSIDYIGSHKPLAFLNYFSSLIFDIHLGGWIRIVLFILVNALMYFLFGFIIGLIIWLINNKKVKP